VTTLAGAPGERGHRDSADARLARFDDPQGLAVAADGTIYVADRGNHVIRKLPPEGGASTLAGMPGQPGSQDGRPTEARFRDLKGLAIGKPVDGALTCTLYVVDGHSVRRVSPAGDVTTLCGEPATPGTPGPGAGTPLDLAWVPCLDNPYGITVAWPRIIVTDRGNHAIQVLRPGSGANCAARAEAAPSCLSRRKARWRCAFCARPTTAPP
jgi:DNA-binding beta-propeller fold protein YncE